ncbi:MAG: D-alanyl-lipoteichoic acid biosynthesis protein DltD, partial [Eggerthellaceae bacterium]
PAGNARLQQADASGDAASTTNDFGIYDADWQQNSGDHVERGQNFSQADEEYADLACFLRVCREAGLEPLVTILPVHGAWYDREGVAHAERQAYYERIRGLCDDAGAAYADFSSCEYEKYFVRHGIPAGAVGAHRAGVLRLRPRSRRRFLGGGRFGAAGDWTAGNRALAGRRGRKRRRRRLGRGAS